MKADAVAIDRLFRVFQLYYTNPFKYKLFKQSIFSY